MNQGTNRSEADCLSEQGMEEVPVGTFGDCGTAHQLWLSIRFSINASRGAYNTFPGWLAVIFLVREYITMVWVLLK